MKKYFFVARQFFANSIMSQMEYRFEAITWTFASILWMLLLFVSVGLVFGQTNLVAGWTQTEVLLVAATEAIFIGAFWLFLLPSLIGFSELIQKGNLDFYLSKPINCRFLISVNRTSIDNLPRIIIAVILLIRFLGDLKIVPGFMNVGGYIAMLILGLLIFYNIFFIAVTSAIWFVKITNLEDLFENTMDVGKYPVYIFEGGLRLFFIYIIPIAFVATFPVQILLGRADYKIIFLALGLAILSFVISQLFWNFALKHYSSASS